MAHQEDNLSKIQERLEKIEEEAVDSIIANFKELENLGMRFKENVESYNRVFEESVNKLYKKE